MISQPPPGCWTTDTSRGWTPGTFESCVLSIVGAPWHIACPAWRTRARYCSSVSAAAPDNPGSWFVHVRITFDGTCVTSWVTVFVGTAQDPATVARQNSGSDNPSAPVTPPSWTTYW